ncbi:MAG: substrate-binding domain-containing protein, partial [Rhodobacteraceae bacterium]|nr:substrate-binding domain-containing protein [Paracoccaceae bacterium]
SNDRARDRVMGVRNVLAEAGLDQSALALIETQYGISTGSEAFREMMALSPRPTAVLCGNDVLAVGALRAAKEMGLSVPGDVSITGFDDIELAMLAEPALTTVHVPHREMGRRAASMLVQMVNGDTLPDSTRLDTDIRLRQSLGPPPSDAA